MTPQRPDDIRRISLKTLLMENTEKAQSAAFINVLQPKNALVGAKENTVSVKSLVGDECVGVEIVSGEFTEIFLYSSTGKINYDGIKAECDWVSVVKNQLGETVKTTRYNRQ